MTVMNMEKYDENGCEEIPLDWAERFHLLLRALDLED